MLVLIDGRSVYTNLYSGGYWDQNDCPLEDIERIEVIRGPGATMWGANAVNGVIKYHYPIRQTHRGNAGHPGQRDRGRRFRQLPPDSPHVPTRVF